MTQETISALKEAIRNCPISLGLFNAQRVQASIVCRESQESKNGVASYFQASKNLDCSAKNQSNGGTNS